MSDLISRKKAISVLEQLEEHSLTGMMHICNAIYLLKNQPTAYDIGEVVEKLERIRAKKTCNKEKCDTKVICRICVVDDAIEIVNQGAVSDDVCEWRLCDEEANVYDTSCRNPHILIEGTPKENNYKYCPYCAKKIKVVE